MGAPALHPTGPGSAALSPKDQSGRRGSVRGTAPGLGLPSDRQTPAARLGRPAGPRHIHDDRHAYEAANAAAKNRISERTMFMGRGWQGRRNARPSLTRSTDSAFVAGSDEPELVCGDRVLGAGEESVGSGHAVQPYPGSAAIRVSSCSIARAVSAALTASASVCTDTARRPAYDMAATPRRTLP